MKRRIRFGWKLALSGLLAPIVLSYASFCLAPGMLQTLLFIYGSLWMTAAIILFFYSAIKNDISDYSFFTSDMTYKQLEIAWARSQNKVKQLEAENARLLEAIN